MAGLSNKGMHVVLLLCVKRGVGAKRFLAEGPAPSTKAAAPAEPPEVGPFGTAFRADFYVRGALRGSPESVSPVMEVGASDLVDLSYPADERARRLSVYGTFLNRTTNAVQERICQEMERTGAAFMRGGSRNPFLSDTKLAQPGGQAWLRRVLSDHEEADLSEDADHKGLFELPPSLVFEGCSRWCLVEPPADFENLSAEERAVAYPKWRAQETEAQKKRLEAVTAAFRTNYETELLDKAKDFMQQNVLPWVYKHLMHRGATTSAQVAAAMSPTMDEIEKESQVRIRRTPAKFSDFRQNFLNNRSNLSFPLNQEPASSNAFAYVKTTLEPRTKGATDAPSYYYDHDDTAAAAGAAEARAPFDRVRQGVSKLWATVRHRNVAATTIVKSRRVCTLELRFQPFAAFRVVPQARFSREERSPTQLSTSSVPSLHTNATIEDYDPSRELEQFILWMNLTPRRSASTTTTTRTHEGGFSDQSSLPSRMMSSDDDEQYDDEQLRLVRDPLVVVHTGATVDDKKKTLGRREKSFTRDWRGVSGTRDLLGPLPANSLRSRGRMDFGEMVLMNAGLTPHSGSIRMADHKLGKAELDEAKRVSFDSRWNVIETCGDPIEWRPGEGEELFAEFENIAS